VGKIDMRLTSSERELIKKAFYETFKDGKIYLFGSRVDDTKRGGDIDLYLCPTQRQENERELKRKFQILLDEYLGEQKIDVVMAKDTNRLIEKEALRTGIEL
jgi:predicted nucleotidyltransferase